MQIYILLILNIRRETFFDPDTSFEKLNTFDSDYVFLRSIEVQKKYLQLPEILVRRYNGANLQ